MVQEHQRNQEYWKKVHRIDQIVGCSHHPQAAVDLIMDNQWAASAGEISPRTFVPEYSFGILEFKEYLEELSPRERVAYETLKSEFMKSMAYPYFTGRVIRNSAKIIREARRDRREEEKDKREDEQKDKREDEQKDKREDKHSFFDALLNATSDLCNGDARLDHIVLESIADDCGSFSAKKAYAIEFPYSATLDKLVGTTTGLLISPLAFISGLVYTPKKNAGTDKIASK